MKTASTFLFLVLLLTACGRHVDNDAALRATFVGTWTTADVDLPDHARVRDITTINNPDGSYVTKYTISRAGESRRQATGGTWQITNGFFIEAQTSVDGTNVIGPSGASKIIQLDSREMILSNWYSRRRVFLRQ